MFIIKNTISGRVFVKMLSDGEEVYSENLKDARIFNTKNLAQRAIDKMNLINVEIRRVKIVLAD